MMDNKSQKSSVQVPEELKLIDYMESIKTLKGFGALHLRLSKLMKDITSSPHYQVALRSFEKFTQHFNGKLFVFHNGDLIFMFQYKRVEDIKKIAVRIRDLFGDPPIASESVALSSDFFRIYDLDKEYPEFVSVAQYFLDLRGLKNVNVPHIEDSREPLTAGKLEKLENALENVDLTLYIHNQPICVILEGKVIKTIFKEFYVSIRDLQKQVLPQTNLVSNVWLFQHLTQTLDKRLLASLIEGDTGIFEGSFSLNLNVETILSPAFMRFDKKIKDGLRGTLVIEFQKIDVYADMGAFLYARQFLKERGYRLCLDGLNQKILPFIDRERLGFDIVKLFWSPTLLHKESLEELNENIKSITPERTILCRCDSPQAIELGEKLGITLFQGRYIDFMERQSK